MPTQGKTPPPATEKSADLAALPSDWRLVRVGRNKAPIGGKDWFQVDDYSPDDAAALNGSSPPAWGLKSGPASGVVVLDLDAEGWEASLQQVTGHTFAELPQTIAWTSGKPGRSGHAFQVDAEWWPHLANRRSWKNASGETCWELRWDRCQSVIMGAHPETGSYRWLPGQSPEWQPDPATAPDWLLEALLVQELPEVRRIAPSADDAGRAVAMLQALPPDQFTSYDSWLRIGMALHHTDAGLLKAWVDWSRSMPSFDEDECLSKWASFDKGHKGRPATIATLHHLAKQHGYKEPKRQRPKSKVVLMRQGSDAGTAVQSEQQQQARTNEQPQAPEPKHSRLITMAEVGYRLREAISEGMGGADLAALVAELAAASEQGSFDVQRMADAIRAEQLQVVAVAAEAQQIEAERDRQEIGELLNAGYLLPPSIAAAIETRSRYLPCCGPSAVLPFLATVAGLVKLGTEVEGSAVAGYRVPINLFACLVGRSGAKKSPIGRLLVEAPTTDLRADLARANQREREAWEQECREMKKGEAKPTAPNPKRLSVSDFTGEALAAQLQTQEAAGLGLLVHRDELSGLFGSLNAYRGGRGADEQQLLELFDGSGLSSLRIVGDRHYSRSQLSIWGSTQPDVLRQLVADGDASGLWARFLFVPLPERAIPLPMSTSAAEAEEVEAAAQTLANTCSTVYRLQPQTYRLAPAAAERFAHYELNRQQAALRATIGAQSALYGKSAGKVLRVAGVLHLLRIATGEASSGALIEQATIEQAAALVDLLDAWALGLHAEVAAGGAGQLMRTVHRVAEAVAGPIRWKELSVKLSAKGRKETDAAAFAEAARALAAAGYGEVETGKRGAISYRATCALP
jgi:hypothetical protein